jgi:hypothetical protein
MAEQLVPSPRVARGNIDLRPGLDRVSVKGEGTEAGEGRGGRGGGGYTGTCVLISTGGVGSGGGGDRMRVCIFFIV